MHILIDNREHKRINNIKEYYTNKGCTCEVLTLETGDLIFQNNTGEVAFEYKTIPDFIASIKDKRVFNQAISMYEKYDYHFVIIVGSDLERENCLSFDGLHPDAYYSAVSRLNTYTTVLQVPDEETAYYMMLDQAEKCLDDAFVYKRLHMKTPNPAQNLLLHCNKIGDETVILLKDELGIYNFNDLNNISYEDLIKIHGIGDKTANMILDYIGETLI